MKQHKIGSLLGLAMKAGKIVSGEFAVEKAIKEGTAELVIIATDASENTSKKFENMCQYYEQELYFYEEKENLGHFIGKEFRASLAVTDAGFAKAVKKHLDSSNKAME